MSTIGILAAWSLQGCYGWEYPNQNDILMVERTSPSARLTVAQLSASEGQHLKKVIEIEGIVRHVVNKGGQPGVTLGDEDEDLGVFLTFGPKERKALGRLVAGQRACFRGLVTKIPSFGYPGEIKPAIVRQNGGC